MMDWYDVIKEQWEWGCYTDRSQLDVYVNAGWITAEQADEIAAPPKVEEPDEDTSTGDETVDKPTVTPLPAN